MMRKIGRILLRLCVALLLGILLLLSTAVLLLSSEKGNRFLLDKVAQALDGLYIGDNHGTLWRGLYLDNLRYQQDNLTINIERLYLQVNAYALLRGALSIGELSSQGLLITLTESETTDGTPFSGLPNLYMPLPIELNKLQLQNNQLQLQGTVIPIDNLQGKATWFGYRLSLKRLSLQSEDKTLTAQGVLKMQNDWPLTVRLSWQMAIPEAVQAYVREEKAQGEVHLSGSVMHLQGKQTMQLPLVISGDFSLKPFSQPLQFHLAQSWPSVEILLDAQSMHINQGRILLVGDLQHYQLQLESQLQWQTWLPWSLQLKSTGDLTQLTVDQLALQQDTQTLDLQGKFAWSPDISWQITGDLQKLQTQPFLSELQGQISASFASQGTWQDALQFTAEINTLDGELQQLPLSGFAQLIWQDQQQSVNAKLALAEHFIQAKGKIEQENIQLDFALKSDNLQQLQADLAGRIAAQIYVQGTKQQPRMKGLIRADNLSYQNLQLAHSELQLTHHTAQEITLRLQQFTIDSAAVLDELRLAINGNNKVQQWHLQMQGMQTDIDSRGQTKMQQEAQWRLSLSQLDVQNTALGLWQLQAGEPWHLSAQQQEIPTFCLKQIDEQGALCASASNQAQQAKAKLNLQNLNLQPLAALFVPELQVYGVLDANIEIAKNQQNLSAKALVEANNGYVQLVDESEGEVLVRVPWQTIQLKANLQEPQYQADLQVLLDENNQLKQTLTGSLADTQTIAGRLQFTFEQLQFVELFTPLRQVQGQITGDLSAQGTLTQPQFMGKISLQDASMQVPDAGLLLHDMTLAIEAEKNGNVSLIGKVYSGDSPLFITGQATQQKSIPWPMQLRVYGENFQAVNLKDMQLWVDPDIQVDIANQTIVSRGKVLVRKAAVKLRTLPESAISPSSDTVIVGEEESAARWAIDTDLSIILNDQFVVEGMGLNAKFSGDVRIQDTPSQPLNLTGVVRVDEGRYKAYGQSLTIERGNILFQGSVDDPGLDLLATRTISRHNVKAGLEIGGTLKNPRSRIVAEPAMDETEAMSWLLFGKPLSSASENDGSAILQAIAVYGIEHGDFMTQKLSDTLGIDVGFDTDGENNQAAFTLGKQLSARLYLRYSVALFESLSSIMLRYRLSPSINLETRSSGDANSIDLLYRTER